MRAPHLALAAGLERALHVGNSSLTLHPGTWKLPRAHSCHRWVVTNGGRFWWHLCLLVPKWAVTGGVSSQLLGSSRLLRLLCGP